MNPEKIEYIRREFGMLTQYKSEFEEPYKWKEKVLRDLGEINWESDSDGRIYLKGLRKLLDLQGSPEGFSLDYAKAIEVDLYIENNFFTSMTKVLEPLEKSKGLPDFFKKLIIDEYLKFYAVADVECGKFSFRDNLFSGLRLLASQSVLYKTENTGVQKRLFDLRDKYSNSTFPEKMKEPINAKAIIKNVIRDPFFSENFKSLLICLLESLNILSAEDLHKIKSADCPNQESSIQKKFYFHQSAGNKQFITFDKNLLFTHFSVLALGAKFDGEFGVIENIYAEDNIRLTIELNATFYPGDLPITVNKDHLKSRIRSLYTGK